MSLHITAYVKEGSATAKIQKAILKITDSKAIGNLTLTKVVIKGKQLTTYKQLPTNNCLLLISKTNVATSYFKGNFYCYNKLSLNCWKQSLSLNSWNEFLWRHMVEPLLFIQQLRNQWCHKDSKWWHTGNLNAKIGGIHIQLFCTLKLHFHNNLTSICRPRIIQNDS